MKAFNHATRIIEGYGVLNCLGEESVKLGAHKVLVVTDNFLVGTDLFKQALKSLEEACLEYEVYDGALPNPSTTSCDELADRVKAEGIDLIVAYGGGSSMDIAKAAAVLAVNGGKCVDWDYKEFPKKMLPVITIPTTSGTGSEVTFVAVITDEERQYKMSLMDERNMVPVLAICDPEVTLALPPHLTASCGVDALTHAIEAYTVKVSQPMTDALALQAMSMISGSILKAYTDGKDKDAREQMMIGSTMAGAAFINSNVGAVHAIAETIGAWFKIPHGVANSLFLPYVMKYNIPAAAGRLAVVAEKLGLTRKEGMTDEEFAMEGVNYIKELNRKLSIPRFSELKDITVDDFDEIAERSARNPLSDDNAREIKKEDYMKILEEAYNDK